MLFDIGTLHLVLTIHLLAAAVLLPVVMGRRVSAAARWAQASVLAQAMAWLLIIVSSHLFERVTTALAIVGLATSLYFLQRALSEWLGERPLEGLMRLACVIGPAGYAIGFESHAFRVGWSNGWLALQMALLCLSTLGAKRLAGLGWRSLIFVCMGVLAIITAWRAVLGALNTATYPGFTAPHPVNMALALLLNLSLVLVTIALLVAWHEEAETQLHAVAVTDGLTGVLNRGAWQERASAQFADAQRHGHGLVLLMLDLDHFKKVNDSLGHDAGDRALQLVARLLLASVRSADLVGRYGGEEFCVLLTHTDPASAQTFDQRLRKALLLAARTEFNIELNYSVGMTALRSADSGITALLKRADLALCTAKQAGRGRMEFAPA